MSGYYQDTAIARYDPALSFSNHTPLDFRGVLGGEGREDL